MESSRVFTAWERSERLLEGASQVGLGQEPNSPISTLLRVLTPMQSAVQGENLDQLLSWQSS